MQREIREPSAAPLPMKIDDFCVIFQAAHLLLIDNRDRMNRFSDMYHGNCFLLVEYEKAKGGHFVVVVAFFGEPYFVN